MSLRTKIVLGSIAAIVLLITSPALYADSAPDEIRHSTTVHYADLNMNKPAGTAALYRRITVAASRVCGPRALTGSYYPLPDYTRCYNKAIATAVAQVDRPQLTAYYHAQTAQSGSQKMTSVSSR
ncbi:MAG TPA: UrcA family protein [Steroidobacteraceae bacterium]|nr:UrcA family protein [Steroidobacteraceae bacterium]